MNGFQGYLIQQVFPAVLEFQLKFKAENHSEGVLEVPKREMLDTSAQDLLRVAKCDHVTLSLSPTVSLSKKRLEIW